MIKNCLQCNKEFIKRNEESYKYFDSKKFCSDKCRTNNRLGTKTGVSNPFYGKKHSKKSLKKMSKSHSGVKISEDTKIKMRQAQLGQKNHFFGKHHTPESITKISGSNNPSWKGGIAPINNKIRASRESILWKKACMLRDVFTCQKTGQHGGKLVVHHIQNFSDFPELRFAIDNGITLSLNAHKEFHKIYGKKNNSREQLVEFLNK